MTGNAVSWGIAIAAACVFVLSVAVVVLYSPSSLGSPPWEASPANTPSTTRLAKEAEKIYAQVPKSLPKSLQQSLPKSLPKSLQQSLPKSLQQSLPKSLQQSLPKSPPNRSPESSCGIAAAPPGGGGAGGGPDRGAPAGFDGDFGSPMYSDLKM